MMSEVVRGRWMSEQASPEVAKAMADTASAAELAIRAAAGVLGVRAVTVLVRHHPILSLMLAVGVGYVVGKGWMLDQDLETAPRAR
jgi:hypothetical protein